MLHTPGATSSICSCPCGSMLHTTSSACPCAGLLPGLSLGYYEVTVCPLALRGHELNGIQNPAPCPSRALSCAQVPTPCPSRALSCAQVSAHLLALRTPHRPAAQPQGPSSEPCPGCSPAPSPQPVHRAAARAQHPPSPCTELLPNLTPLPAPHHQLPYGRPQPASQRTPLTCGAVPARCLPGPARSSSPLLARRPPLPDTVASAGATPTAAATPIAQAVRGQRAGKAAPPRFGNTDNT